MSKDKFYIAPTVGEPGLPQRGYFFPSQNFSNIKKVNSSSGSVPLQPKFSVYRCPDPIKTETSQPWYRISNICPCNPIDSNPTGRGMTPCTFGIQTDSNSVNFIAGIKNTKPEETKELKGSWYPQTQFVPNQLQSRPLSRIGQQWRSAN